MSSALSEIRTSPARAKQETSYPCRLLGHAWTLTLPDPADPKWEGVRALHLECMRCKMRRHDPFDQDGTVQGRRYEPPSNYYLGKTEEPPTRAELRKWALRRARRLMSQSEETNTN